MDEKIWDNVDNYLAASLVGEDDVLRGALQASEAAGLPSIAVSPLQGRFLHLLARLAGARHILEIGTLGGYSAIWMGRALPSDGRLVSLELEPRHAEVARANLDRAGLSGVAEVRVGPALQALPGLAAQFGERFFDLAFIDADKANIPAYFSWALRLTRPGGVVVVDNVVRDGRVADEASSDPSVRGVRRLFEAISGDPSVLATALQTVGVKGYDGFALALVGAGPALA